MDGAAPPGAPCGGAGFVVSLGKVFWGFFLPFPPAELCSLSCPGPLVGARRGVAPMVSQRNAPGAVFETVPLSPSFHSMAKVIRVLTRYLSPGAVDYNFLVRNI